MEINKELLITEEIETVIEAVGKDEASAMQDIFKKHRIDIHSHVEGYIVEMHVISFVAIEYKRETFIKKFLWLFLPQEHERYYLKIKLISHVKTIKK
ncbi:MAG: DUF4312 family protein [Anaerorhabdus sp.]